PRGCGSPRPHRRQGSCGGAARGRGSFGRGSFPGTFVDLRLDRNRRSGEHRSRSEKQERTGARGALIALDQMDGGKLKGKTAAPIFLLAFDGLTRGDPATKQTASWIISHHPEWGDQLASFLESRLDSKELTMMEQDELSAQLA